VTASRADKRRSVCNNRRLIGAIVYAERGANISLGLRTFLQWMSR